MNRIVAGVVTALVFCCSHAADVKDAPIPTQMNWVGIGLFMLVFFGLSIGFVYLVWKQSRKKEGEPKAQAK